MTDPTEDDIHALRHDGDLRAYLRDLIRKPTTTPTARAGPAHGPLHRPGAWPHGTHPTTSATCRPDCACATEPPPA